MRRVELLFENRVVVYETFAQLDDFIKSRGIDVVYNIVSGERGVTNFVSAHARNVFHAVFHWQPFGDRYAAISEYVQHDPRDNIVVVPHMVEPVPDPESVPTWRARLNIPPNAVVVGCLGGVNQFDVDAARWAMQNVLENTEHIWFVCVNINPRLDAHPRLILCDTCVDIDEKRSFIATCDAMLHARSDGETFGLAVAEFAAMGRPVVTCRAHTTNFNKHLELLEHHARIYTNEKSCLRELLMLTRLTTPISYPKLKMYEPANVMEQFERVFLSADAESRPAQRLKLFPRS